MAHIRKQIRDAVVTLLTGLATTGSKVYPNRVWPLSEAELPGILVMADADTVSSYSEGSLAANTPRNINRLAHLTVQALARGDAIDDQLDQICLEVEKALAADRFLGGLSVNVTLVDTRIQLKGDGEKPTGEATMSYLIEYWVLDTTPDVRG
jgi:hypothetical protein